MAKLINPVENQYSLRCLKYFTAAIGIIEAGFFYQIYITGKYGF
jgi:hypothetical protein